MAAVLWKEDFKKKKKIVFSVLYGVRHKYSKCELAFFVPYQSSF